MGKSANARRIYGFIISYTELREKMNHEDDDTWEFLQTLIENFKKNFLIEDELSFIEVGDNEGDTYFVIGLEKSKVDTYDTYDDYYVEETLEEQSKILEYLQRQETNILNNLSHCFFNTTPKMGMYYRSCIYP